MASDNFFLENLRSNFGAFYLGVNVGYDYVNYQQTIIAPALEAITTGKLKRLAVFEPPRHSKSEEITIAFSAYFLGKFPSKRVMVISYSDDLAFDFGRRTRNIMETDLYKRLFPQSIIERNSRAKNAFSTISRGGYSAAGLDGKITGIGTHLLIMDDWIKNSTSANSEAEEATRRAIYNSTVRTRLEPGASIILVMTKWPGDSFSGWVLEEQGGSDELGSAGLKELAI